MPENKQAQRLFLWMCIASGLSLGGTYYALCVEYAIAWVAHFSYVSLNLTLMLGVDAFFPALTTIFAIRFAMVIRKSEADHHNMRAYWGWFFTTICFAWAMAVLNAPVIYLIYLFSFIKL